MKVRGKECRFFGKMQGWRLQLSAKSQPKDFMFVVKNEEEISKKIRSAKTDLEVYAALIFYPHNHKIQKTT